MDILKQEVFLLLLSIFLHESDSTGGPIQHSNGLCIFPKDDKTTGQTLLVWSTNCFSQDANFLVSYDYSIYHIDSGKCFFPKNGKIADPDDTGKFVLERNNSCGKLKFRPSKNNGYLGYYTSVFVGVCIGEGRDSHEPVEGDEVMFSKSACNRTESCQHLSCVFELIIRTYNERRIFCPNTFLIQVTWAYYGMLEQKVPVKLGVSKCDVKRSTKLIKRRCNGRRECWVEPIRLLHRLGHCSEFSITNNLVVRYSCIQETKPAAPSQVTIHVLSMNQMMVTWSPQETRIEDPIDWYSVCWKMSTSDRKCNNGNITSSSLELNHLTSSTKYFVYVASHSCKGGIGNYNEPKIGITRAAPIKQSNKSSSAKNFEILFGVLKADDKYIQIIIKKQASEKQPKSDPDRYSNLTSYNEKSIGNVPYIAAELDRDYVTVRKCFTVGDGKRYSKSINRKRRDVQFLNVKLEPDTYYSVFQRTFQNDDLYYNSEWMKVVQTADTKDTEKKNNGTPTPDQPDKVKPTSDQPDKVKPARDQPDKVKPTPDQPDKVKPTPDQPDNVKPTPDRPDKVKPARDQPDKVKPTPDQPDKVKPTPDQPDKIKPTPDQPDPNQENEGGKTSGLKKSISFIIPLSVVSILLLILLLIVFRKKLQCCARKNNRSAQVVNIDTSAAEEGYMGMEFLDNQSENQYLNTIDRENQFQNKIDKRVQDTIPPTMESLHGVLEPCKYLVIKQIGCGSCGKVYLCQTQDRLRHYAVKQVGLGVNDRETREKVKDLKNEIQILKILKHNNIVVFYFYEETVQTLSIFMEYVSGGSVSDYVVKNGEMEENLVRKYTYQILKGCEYLHRNNVIHRDIKGGNVLIDDAKGNIRLADFGIAKDLQRAVTSTGSTTDESFHGTIYWCSPEHLKIEDPTYVFDIWSVGCTVVEMLTTKPPYRDLDYFQVMYSILNKVFHPPDNLSSLAKTFIELCFKKKEERSDATELLLNEFPAEYEPDARNKVDKRIQDTIQPTMESLHGVLEPREYCFIKQIGCGSCGNVYLCQTNDRLQNYAVKQVDLGENDRETQKKVEDLKKEIQILKRLKHINIVTFYFYEETVQALSIFMEYVPGGSVSDYVMKNGEMAENLVRKYTYQILKGCEYLHRNNVIHRDIKGGNVLIDDAKGSIQLADFGIAKDLQRVVTSTCSTTDESFCGTIYWCSPEHLKTEDPTYVFDIWSVGCTVVEMLTTKPPHHDLDFFQAMHSILNKVFYPPDHLSLLAKTFIELCFKKKEERPNATELLKNEFPAEYMP